MGIIADRFKAALEDLRRIDAESQIATDNLLISLRQLSADLEALELDELDDG